MSPFRSYFKYLVSRERGEEKKQRYEYLKTSQEMVKYDFFPISPSVFYTTLALWAFESRGVLALVLLQNTGWPILLREKKAHTQNPRIDKVLNSIAS